eukprot:gnl/MRDRNA2_/MRDRNA2_95894_c0_seq1.p1 gnl/MRDRNA2_/MRDRNA2_95894_c0~~gnl/MRDRNA2_/MRDRNA2_95894_c0_seq1.p1  ORF type:complete len:181 (+),score=24.34 gnl/MRDRNA2_/MRDRNA2_95894_c0_seq1:133-675(+)
MLHSLNGPGRINKWFDLERAPCKASMDQPRNVNVPSDPTMTHWRLNGGLQGRDLWRNNQNPFQFDISYVRRLEIAKQKLADKYENAPPLSMSHSAPSLGSESSASRYPGFNHQAAFANSIRNVPNTMPGYQGYVPHLKAENIFSKSHARTSSLCAETRTLNGRRYDGVCGWIPPPQPFSL